MAHWIASVIIFGIVCFGAIFAWGWMAHEKFSRNYHDYHQTAVNLPSIERSRSPEPTTHIAPPAATTVHVHLHQPPENIWAKPMNNYGLPAWKPRVIEGEILQLPAAQGS